MFSFKYKNFDFSHKLNNYLNSGDDFGKHLHYFYEIIYFVKGDCKYFVESSSLTLSPGDIVIIPFGKYHHAEINNHVDYERYVIKLPAEALPNFIKDKLDKCGPFFTNNKKYELIFSQFDSYVENYTSEEVTCLVSAEIIKLLILLYNKNPQNDNSSLSFISKIIDYIDANIKEDLSLNVFVKEFNFSKSYISNEFKKYMKVPLMKYIRSKKIIEAHKLIISGQKKTAVAKQFGFDDYSTFYRSYIRTFKDDD